MNLIKLFNVKYFFQNLKKSKTLLSLTILIVPILTLLILININDMDINLTDMMYGCNTINLLGMYVIPICISFILFGYVFKRKSVDFIGSMPINRKSIFITNLIGGILIITLIQMLNFLVIGLSTIFLENIVLSFNAILDFCLVGIVSYTFVYTATNIAMAISGNLLTQIAVTMLIVFLVPFSIDAVKEFDLYPRISFYRNSTETINIDLVRNVDSTLPYGLIKNTALRNSNLVTNISMAKMLVLSICYSIIGLLLFEKRKMENTEESFYSIYMHLFVKGLTLTPIISVLAIIDAPPTELALLLAVIFVYYYVYDIITNRKVKLKVEIPVFVLTVLILFGAFKGAHYIFEDKETIYSKSDIKSICISNYIYDGYYTNSTAVYDLKQMNYEFTDAEIINEFYSGLDYTMSYYDGIYNRNNINVKIKLQDGKEFCGEVSLKSTNYKKILSKIRQDDGYKKAVAEDLKLEDNNFYNLIYLNQNLTKEEKTKIINMLKETTENVDNVLNKEIEFNTNSNFDTNTMISWFYYKNHKFYEVNIPIDINKDLESYLKNKSNECFDEGIEYTNNKDYSYAISTNQNMDIGYRNDKFSKKLLEFVKSASKNVDVNKEYRQIDLSIYGEDFDKRYYFYTNDVESVDKIIKEYGESTYTTDNYDYEEDYDYDNENYDYTNFLELDNNNVYRVE